MKRRPSLPTHPLRSGVAGFSLMELLIGIAIVAVLLALFFPALATMRASSDDARCLQHLRQTGAAHLRYLAEHNGIFLPTKFWYSRISTAESPGMRDYLGVDTLTKSTSPALYVDTVLTCPRLKTLAPLKFGTMFNRCYSINTFLIRKSVSQPDVPDAPDNPGSPRILAAVPAPSRMWAFMDGATGDLGDSSSFATAVSEFTISKGELQYPHKGRQNIVFLDGHVEALTREELLNPASAREFWGDLRKP